MNEYTKYPIVCKELYDGDEDLKIISDIQNFSKKNIKFDTSYVNSVERHLEAKGMITSSQYDILLNIYLTCIIQHQKCNSND